MYKRILVPTDGSARSRKAARNAIRFAKEQHAKVVGLYVAPPYEPGIYAEYVPADFVGPDEYAANVGKTAEKFLEVIRKAAAAAGVACTCSHVVGQFPHLEILKAAKRGRCDLVFMASHGRSGLERLLLGSVTSKVLAHSTIPVLVDR